MPSITISLRTAHGTLSDGNLRARFRQLPARPEGAAPEKSTESGVCDKHPAGRPSGPSLGSDRVRPLLVRFHDLPECQRALETIVEPPVRAQGRQPARHIGQQGTHEVSGNTQPAHRLWTDRIDPNLHTPVLVVVRLEISFPQTLRLHRVVYDRVRDVEEPLPAASMRCPRTTSSPRIRV